MTVFIKNPQKLKIERREWYDYLQHDISPLYEPSVYDTAVAQRLCLLDASPETIRFFARHCEGLSDYIYWFCLGTCWVCYTGWSELELWKSLFASERPHRDSCLMKPTELRHFRALPKVVHCYRVHRPDERDWISYTLDLDTAKAFANRRGVTKIHEYRIPRRHLLCLFLRRGEYEVLCLDKDQAQLVQVRKS